MAYVREREMECGAVEGQNFSWLFAETSHTVAPILPLMVMTTPIIALPSTQAPIANFQLRPTAMMDEATHHKK